MRVFMCSAMWMRMCYVEAYGRFCYVYVYECAAERGADWRLRTADGSRARGPPWRGRGDGGAPVRRARDAGCGARFSYLQLCNTDEATRSITALRFSRYTQQ